MTSQQLLGILQVRISSGGWDELPLYRPMVMLGRSAANPIILQDPKVSSQHAELSLGPSGWLVSDQGSSNGTFLDGQRLPPRTPVPFQPGQTLTIGSFALSLRQLRPNEPPPPSLGDQVRIEPKPQPGLAVYAGAKVLKFPLEKSLATLGRKQGSDIRLQDPLVSGRHAQLERQGNTYRIVDMGSTNGLTYEGQRVSQHLFADGDVLYIGKQIAIQYRAYIGFLPGAAEKKVEAPKTEYLDM
jgi:pSer/pThr/pTyr-binding forkhead associated (FHA) protein